ncbi:Rossmann-like domain-containing protein [Methanocaldococcus fervens]|uniref:Heavy-metal chelation domain-containing protein n=1 Tax=Methanocaldococcus fervens (strain DSM 4213 / JCM 15782 / AG86) TaxID=573064 RepID=C7P7J8_METFA|nr:DUF364 domain-containing protein [Methanocaldococcus fervens]ACV24530.1 protein of unknown function DUF364 [Methanocaldococcus fervens AG86]
MIIDHIIKKAKDITNNYKFKILDFSFALPYSYVLIEKDGKKSLGVAMTLLEEYKGHSEKRKVDFGEKTIEDFITMANDLDVINRTLGLAAINAVSQYFIKLNEDDYKRDVINLILNKKGIKKIAFIGNMMPLVKMLKEKGDFEFYVFERNPKISTPETISDAFEYTLLPKMDAVLISGTSILNNSLDMILDRAKNAKLKILVGPSAQILPEFVKGYGIDYIASTHILGIDKALYNLKLGSSFGLFKKYSKKYIVKV